MHRKEIDPDDLHCTARKCKNLVNPGFGIQFVDGDIMQRYCWACWQKLSAIEEEAANIKWQKDHPGA